jgi:hypothetical protein
LQTEQQSATVAVACRQSAMKNSCSKEGKIEKAEFREKDL